MIIEKRLSEGLFLKSRSAAMDRYRCEDYGIFIDNVQTMQGF